MLVLTAILLSPAINSGGGGGGWLQPRVGARARALFGAVRALPVAPPRAPGTAAAAPPIAPPSDAAQIAPPRVSKAPKGAEDGGELILQISGRRYNITAYAHEHPGGQAILRKFRDRDATEAFLRAHHSKDAHRLLRSFLVPEEEEAAAIAVAPPLPPPELAGVGVLGKLFTHEDRSNVHKLLGVFVLLHFAARYGALLLAPHAPVAGLAVAPALGFACLAAHGALSASSLKFAVPRERVVGKPMIWAEFRAHNIIFGLRSVACSAACLGAMVGGTAAARRSAELACAACVLLALRAADLATARLRVDTSQSTTATMPYPDGWQAPTVRRFKSFYAYSQYMATLGCLACTNPSYGLIILLPIQLASLLMTLVRKGLISAGAYHLLYAGSLCMPYVVALRHAVQLRAFDAVALLPIASALLALRRRGVSKYALWGPIVGGRLLLGDALLTTPDKWLALAGVGVA